MPATTASVDPRMKQSVLTFATSMPARRPPRRSADREDVAPEPGARQQERSATNRAVTSGTTHGTPWMTIGAFGRWRSWLSSHTATSRPASPITFAAHNDNRRHRQ